MRPTSLEHRTILSCTDAKFEQHTSTSTIKELGQAAMSVFDVVTTREGKEDASSERNASDIGRVLEVSCLNVRDIESAMRFFS